jgi:hypothetical protein
MPPQQSQSLLDFFRRPFDFRSHDTTLLFRTI